ncbi:MAG: hypothetical protein AAGE93_20685 [Bacteroidota bacterium]
MCPWWHLDKKHVQQGIAPHPSMIRMPPDLTPLTKVGRRSDGGSATA